MQGTDRSAKQQPIKTIQKQMKIKIWSSYVFLWNNGETLRDLELMYIKIMFSCSYTFLQ